MDIVQTFYDKLATQYDKLFMDWQSTTKEQALILDKILNDYGFGNKSSVLDCACGIGTQSVGLASLGYNVTASDISDTEIQQAMERAENNNVKINFKNCDFRNLSKVFTENFDVIIAMDNALPHMLTKEDLESAVKSITGRLSTGGIFVASIRDYDKLLESKPPYSPPYIHKTSYGQRVSFQTWEWSGNHYKLTQYIIDDETSLQVNKYECEYRAFKRDELTELLFLSGCTDVQWKFPPETGFYQPIVIAKK